MSDDTLPDNDTQDGVEDDGSDDTTEALSHEEVPENAHITACGDVISNDGEHLGEIDRGGVSSTGNPHTSDGQNTVFATLQENTHGYVSVEAVEELRGDETPAGEDS